MSLYGGDLDLALAAARDGQEQGFAELWQRLQPAVFRYLQAVVGDAAAEVAVATWQEAAGEVRRFRGDSTGFRVWLFRVARYRALEEARRSGTGDTGDRPGSAGRGGFEVEISGAVTDNARVAVDERSLRGMGAGVGTSPATATTSGGGVESGGRESGNMEHGDGSGGGRLHTSAGAGPAVGETGAQPGPPATERALRLMATLPREESEAVLLRVVAGLDVAQSAMVLGVRDEAARTAAARGLRALALIAAEASADSEDGWRRAGSSD
jgi:RNA polymerase sigma-70 factor (ECF subfamily)